MPFLRPAVLSLLTLGAVASAQTNLPAFELERLRLNASGADTLVVGAGTQLAKGAFRASLTGHYENSPLSVRVNGGYQGALVRHRMNVHLSGAYAFTDWLQVEAQLPFFFAQSGDDPAPWGLNRPASAGLSTPFLGASVAPLRQSAGDKINLSAGILVGLPIGSAEGYSRDPSVSAIPRVAVGHRYTNFLVSAEVGALLRAGAQLHPNADSGTTNLTGSEFLWGLTGATNEGVLGQLRVEASVRGGVSFTGTGAAAEILLGARYPLGRWLELSALAGPGFGSIPGAPVFRALLGLSARTPAGAAKDEPAGPLDRDGDGVPDSRDDCIDVAANTVNGCPEQVAAPPPPPPDTDGDGVPDAKDKCPTQAGDPAADGCVPDTDGDGIVDSADACPAEKGVAEMRGCPDPDTDGDAVVDRLDNCPKEKGPVDNQGCPAAKKQLVVITKEKLVIKEKVYFATGKATVLPKSFKLLDQVSKLLVEHPEIPTVAIEGHTDNVGSADKNRVLSQKRAEAVKAYMVKKKVPAERLKPIGYGPDRPADTNDTPAGRENNRRVEFTFATP